MDVEAPQDTNMGCVGLVGSLEPMQDHEIAEMIRRAVQRFTVSEVYRSPRITKEIREGEWKHLVPGFALDLTVIDPSDGLPLDFRKKSKREKATALLRLSCSNAYVQRRPLGSRKASMLEVGCQGSAYTYK